MTPPVKCKMQNSKCKMAARLALGAVLVLALAAVLIPTLVTGDVYAQGQPARGTGAGPAGQTGPAGGGRGPAPGPIRRTADGKPDLSGFYESNGRGANYGLEEHKGSTLMPPGQGIIVDPPDGRLPMQEWA